MFDNMFLAVLNMSLVASYVIIFVLLIRFALKKIPTIFTYALWSIAFIRLLCPFSFESMFSVIPIGNQPIPQDIIYSRSPQISTGITVIDNVINPSLPAPTDLAASINPIQVWLFLGVIIWVSGIVAMLIYSIISFIKLKRRLITSTPLKDNIYIADHITTPFVFGVLNPKIYLPSSLSDADQSYIIRHEKCHIKRLDHITRILGFIALSIHWFNPLVWIAFIFSGKDMELSCDEAVMKSMATDIKAEYSQSLLRFSSNKKMIHATPLAFGEGDTKGRIKNVLNYKRPKFWVISISALLCVVVMFCLLSNPRTEREPNATQDLSVENLWKNRTEYVGNNSAVGNIISNLTFPDKITYDSFELYTNAHPYSVTVNFKTDRATQEHYSDGANQQEFLKNAFIMFSLIENVE